MDRREQGNLGEASAIKHLAERGFTVCIPVTEDNHYDLVAVKDNEPELVQVKSSSRLLDNGSYEVELRQTHREKDGSIRRTRDEYKKADILFVWTPDACYYIPTNSIDNSCKIKLSPFGKYQDFAI